jgi:hypothetical protein
MGPALILVVGVVSSVIGAAVWALIVYLANARRQRSGAAAGDWYEITYDPRNSSRVWSIEWVESRHQGHSLNGVIWRLYPDNLDYRWHFHGRCNDARIWLHYWTDRGNGGDGSIKLYQLRRSNYLGRFEEEIVDSFKMVPSLVDVSSPMEWIRVGSVREAGVMKMLQTVDETELLVHLPRRIKRKLRERLGLGQAEAECRPLAFGDVLSDLDNSLVSLKTRHEGSRTSADKSEREHSPGAD